MPTGWAPSSCRDLSSTPSSTTCQSLELSRCCVGLFRAPLCASLLFNHHHHYHHSIEDGILYINTMFPGMRTQLLLDGPGNKWLDVRNGLKLQASLFGAADDALVTITLTTMSVAVVSLVVASLNNHHPSPLYNLHLSPLNNHHPSPQFLQRQTEEQSCAVETSVQALTSSRTPLHPIHCNTWCLPRT